MLHPGARMLARVVVLANILSGVLGLGILFPAYFCPDPSDCSATDCPNYASISKQITAHPAVPFYIIVNPATGPGSSSPAQGYQTCIPTLTSAGTNGVVLGYVHTSFGSRSSSDVEGDISTYAQWGSSFRPTGIFFDEASSSSANVSLYASYASFARQQGFTFIVFNPGTTPDSGYFTSADLVVTFENAYSTFAISDISSSASAPAGKQSVLLYAGPSTSPTTIINELGSAGVGTVFITDDTLPNPWDTVPTDWTEEVTDVSKAT